MPSAHAVLSPSAAERWLSCPASVRVAEKVPKPPESPYAREGTLAHALAELEARHHFGQSTKEERDSEYEAWRASAGLDVDTIGEMTAHVAAYIALVEERLELYPMSQVRFEQRMDTGVEACWGTSDTVIVSPVHVEIIDLKYGMGVQVPARRNPQLRLYGLGALDTFGDVLGDTQVVRITVFQPRLQHVDTEELTADELRAWREEIRPVAASALHDDDAPFGPSETACRWCPAAGDCRARVALMTAQDFGVIPDDDLIDDEELAELFVQLPDIRKWTEAIEQAALRRAYSEQRQLPGLKVVMSGGRRVISDEPGLATALEGEGFVPAQFTTSKMKGIGDLQKLVGGKKRFDELVVPFLTKTEGKPSLVPEDDRRKAIDPNGQARSEFEALTE